MKEDVIELPPVPRKRRQLEGMLDLHIAMLLDTDLSPGDRKRLEQERARRKAEAKRGRLLVGLVVPEEGLDRPQLDAVIEALNGSGATEVIHPGVQQKLHSACKALGVPVDVRYGDGELAARVVVREADVVIAAPKESKVMPYSTPGVWMRIGYAKHRGVPVKVIMPDGRELQGDAA